MAYRLSVIKAYVFTLLKLYVLEGTPPGLLKMEKVPNRLLPPLEEGL